jgi:glutaredoxin
VQVEIYTRDGCTRCVETKMLLNNRNIAFTEKKIGVDIDRNLVLERFPNQKALPIVVFDGSVVSYKDVPLLINK